MIGVLIAAGPTERSWPGLVQTLDLIQGGLRIRLRPGKALSDRAGWRDSLAVFSVAGPVLVLAAVGVSYDADQKWVAFPGFYTSVLYLVLYGQALVVPLVLLRQRWAPVVVASVQVLAVAVLTGLVISSRFWPGNVIAGSAALAAPSLAEIAALLLSAGPRRGITLLRVRHWACLAAAVVPAAVLMPTFFLPRWFRTAGPYRAGDSVLTLITAVAAAALLVLFLGMWLSSAAGKRLAVLFAGLAYPYLLGTAVTNYGVVWLQQAGVLASAPIALIACMVAWAVIRSGRSRPADGSPPTDQQPGSSEDGQVA